jgi:hypothetical protein
MTAPVVAPERARIDTLLADLVVELRAAGFVAAADRVDAAHDDNGRAAALFDLTDRVEVVDRRIFLRWAIQWTARSLESWAEGSTDEALRWRYRANEELKRYRGTPRGDSQ